MIVSILLTVLLYNQINCSDLILGYPDLNSKVIYDKVQQENPAIWVRSKEITVNSSDHEVINAIRVLDLRPDKWGEVYLKKGGIGQMSVTLELNSPSIFRGYNFLVEVYAIQTGHFMNYHGK
ncbi:unnamed protein product [Colias eurytheme]|nr:unnamed protein product [Colias eurytheme]